LAIGHRLGFRASSEKAMRAGRVRLAPDDGLNPQPHPAMISYCERQNEQAPTESGSYNEEIRHGLNKELQLSLKEMQTIRLVRCEPALTPGKEFWQPGGGGKAIVRRRDRMICDSTQY
jgi:hypothetical protein